MSNRVLLNTSGLKVSRPGVNVLTAGNADLNFNSDWSGVNLLISGQVRVENGGTQIIYFGKTFDQPPVCRIPYLQDGFGWWFYLTFGAANLNLASVAQIYTNRLEFRNTSGSGYWAGYFIWNYSA